MNFFSPWMLLGLLAVAVPPIIHLIHRRKAEVVRFPALEFIRRSNKKTARTFRLKQFLLMLMRALLLGALAFAVARPFYERGASVVAPVGGMQGPTVFVLDASWPMAYRLGDVTLLDRGRFMLGTLLERLDGPAAVVIAGEKVDSPLTETTQDLDAVRRAVEGVVPAHVTGNLGEAVLRAYELLGAGDAVAGGRVVVLTTPAGAASALPPPPSVAGHTVELVPVDVADGAPLPNRALLDVRLRPAPEMGAGQWRIDARVANFSDAPIARLPLHLELDGAVQVRGFLDLPAGGEAQKTFYTTLDRREATPASVVLEGDALAADDRRDFWLQPAPRVRVLAVDGEPHPTPYLDELFYFERAVAPRTAADARVELTVTGTDTLDRHKLTDFDVLLLANVADLSEDQGRTIEAYVRAGGGLWITMGPRVEPALLNARLGAVLPRALRDVRQSGDAAATEEGGDRRRAHPGVFDRNHPILRPFGDPAASSLGRVSVDRYMLLDPSPDAGGEVVITLDDGAPYLLTRTLDEGRVALLTGSLDRDWGDLPIRPDFVPLVQQVLRHLTRVGEVDTTPVLVGRAAPIPVEDQRVRRVQVRTPEGVLHTVDRPRDAELRWVFEQTRVPGHYQVSPDPPLPGMAPVPGFAVALDPAGSDLRGPAVKAPAGAQAEAVQAALGGGRRTELWHAALLGLFGFLLAEAVLLFRRRRSTDLPAA